MTKPFFHNREVSGSIPKQTSRSFFSTLLLSFLLISAVTTLLLTAFLMTNYMNALTDTTENYNQQLQAQTNFAIDRLNESVNTLSSSLLTNYNVKSYLALKDIQNITPVIASLEIRDQVRFLPDVESVYLYNSGLDILYSSSGGYQRTPAFFEDADLAAQLNDTEFLAGHYGMPIAACRNPDTGSAEIIRYYYPENYLFGNESPNVIIINARTSALTDSIASMRNLAAETESSFILLDENQEYITSVLDDKAAENSQWLEEALEVISSGKSLNSPYIKINGEYYFQVHTTENCYGWLLLNFIPVSVVLGDILPASLLSLVLAALVLGFSFLICRQLAKRLNSPIESLIQTINGKQMSNPDYVISGPREIQTILSAVSSLQESNREMYSLQQRTRYSLIQSYLRSLVLNSNQDSPEARRARLMDLKLDYLDRQRLCMVLLKIDNYQDFLNVHDFNELWVIRFSVVNITEELAGAHFICNAFSMDNDKFVLLIDSETKDSAASFEGTLLETLRSIQENMEKYLHFTVSIAYSTIFHGLEQLPFVYKNVENAILAKMRYGHNCIIDPYQTEEVSQEPFQISYRTLSQLVDELSNARFESAWEIYTKATELLFFCDYTEIMSSMIHFAYSIYERISEKFPMQKEALMEELKSFHTGIQTAEVSDDIQKLAKTFLQSICNDIQKIKDNPDQQSNALVTEKIIQMILKDYDNPALCLNSIADEIGLSTNYVGHIFKQQTQKSISQYILDIRMDKVAEYLKNTSLSLSKILEKVGLEKNNYFYTRFKNYFGMSLNEYRQQFRSEEEEE